MEKWHERYKVKDNIILIGMPGVGKSTIGVILAKILGYKFVDADLVIQEQEGRLLKDIIATEGVEGFISIENRINTSINPHMTIIATGGSAVYGREAMEHYKEIGRIVYLKADFNTISGRIDNISGRGVVLKSGQTLQDIYNERCPLYEKYADIIVDEYMQDVEETISKIVKRLEA